MRSGSHPVTGSILAAGFLAGWLSASWISPAPVTTQVAPPRPAPVAPTVDIPHVALHLVQAPDTTPAAGRNPFVFRERAVVATRATVAAAAAPAMSVPTDAVAAEVVEVSPTWRLVGLAVSDDGTNTAILSGPGDLQFAAVGTRLPGGAEVTAIAGAQVTLRLATGESRVLVLP